MLCEILFTSTHADITNPCLSLYQVADVWWMWSPSVASLLLFPRGLCHVFPAGSRKQGICPGLSLPPPLPFAGTSSSGYPTASHLQDSYDSPAGHQRVTVLHSTQKLLFFFSTCAKNFIQHLWMAMPQSYGSPWFCSLQVQLWLATHCSMTHWLRCVGIFNMLPGPGASWSFRLGRWFFSVQSYLWSESHA